MLPVTKPARSTSALPGTAEAGTTVRYHPRKPNGYSAHVLRKPVPFLCLKHEAREVCVIGDFNNWEAGSHRMKRQLDGAWRLEIALTHGHHRYLFLVDGVPTLDPNAQGICRNEQGEPFSLIAVS